MQRPWVTPEEVKAYTEYKSVKERSDDKLKVDISRAEQYVIGYTNNSFEDIEETPENVRIAVILIAEMYAASAGSAAEGFGLYKSESFDDYSYTAEETTGKIDNLTIGPLLEEYCIAEPRRAVTLKARAW